MQVESGRLEVRLPEPLLALLKREASRRRVPMAELVREAVRQLLESDHQARLAAAEALFRAEAPVADWETMKREISAAYAGDA